jgi:hypothetical protein
MFLTLFFGDGISGVTDLFFVLMDFIWILFVWNSNLNSKFRFELFFVGVKEIGKISIPSWA